MMFQMMNEQQILAQQPLRRLQSILAMEELQCNSAGNGFTVVE
jgi:hypothetical protein